MVDIVHHGIIGLAGALIAHHAGSPELAAGFLFGSILPDLDVAFMVLGKAQFLRFHQSITHSFLVLPILSLGFASLLFDLLEADLLSVFLGCLAGASIHVGLDAMNTFGVRALWPLKRRFAFDLFFFIDLPLLFSSGIALAAIWLLQVDWVAVAGWASVVAAYGLSRAYWHSKVLRCSGADIAIPSGILPLTYFLTRRTGSGFELGLCEGWNCRTRWTNTHSIVVERQELDVLQSSSTYRDLSAALRLFVPVDVKRVGKGWRITSRCIAVRNFNNRYGEHVADIQDGKLIHEDARL
jgi:membrane-bound metal-dependent hydrolase YbcI (DUF457 family)